MVLCLPILLLIMALMVNCRVVVCWKIRAQSIARLAVWGSRSGRTGSTNPRPDYWPETAGVGVGSEEYLPALDNPPALDDPRVDQPVARGPMLFRAIVNEELLDPTRGFRQGSADLDGQFPVVSKMGRYHVEATTDLLDDKWQYHQMRSRIDVGNTRVWKMIGGKWQWQPVRQADEEYRLGSNRQPRIPVIYTLPKAPSALVGVYVQTALTLLYAAFQPQLRPLDNDEEFLLYRGYAPDFHPRLRRFCGLDPAPAEERKENLVDRIQGKVEKDEEGNLRRRIPGVPERMTRAFIGLYQGVIAQLKSQADTGPLPPAARTQIRELENKVAKLKQFLATLQN